MISLMSLNASAGPKLSHHAGKVTAISTLVALVAGGLFVYNLIGSPGKFLPISHTGRDIALIISGLFVFDAIRYLSIYYSKPTVQIAANAGDPAPIQRKGLGTTDTTPPPAPSPTENDVNITPPIPPRKPDSAPVTIQPQLKAPGEKSAQEVHIKKEIIAYLQTNLEDCSYESEKGVIEKVAESLAQSLAQTDLAPEGIDMKLACLTADLNQELKLPDAAIDTLYLNLATVLKAGKSAILTRAFANLTREYFQTLDNVEGCGDRAQFYIDPAFKNLSEFARVHPEFASKLPKKAKATTDGSNGASSGLARMHW